MHRWQQAAADTAQAMAKAVRAAPGGGSGVLAACAARKRIRWAAGKRGQASAKVMRSQFSALQLWRGARQKVRRARTSAILNSNQLQDLSLGGDGRREAERHERDPQQQIKQDFHGWKHRVLGACRSGTRVDEMAVTCWSAK